MTKTFAVDTECHYLERRRYSCYQCDKCGCKCILDTPQGKLNIVQDGVITRHMAIRVLNALDLPVKLADKLN